MAETENIRVQGESSIERERLEAQLKQALREADEWARTIIMDHPVLTLLGAASLGYLAGRMMSRR